jgi:hypothetical protein
LGFLLLDRPNVNGRHYYPTRNSPLMAIVVHITAGAEDLDTLDDLSAENVAHYAATTDRDVSWHTGSDADSWVDLLPSSYTAWHATDYNSTTHGHEISKRTTEWRGMPEQWVDKTLRMAALGPGGNAGLRKVALDNGIPLQWATRAELDAQIANYRAGRPWKRVGFITHHEVQPDDRTDPGYVRQGGQLIDTFPRARFMALLTIGTPTQPARRFFGDTDMDYELPPTPNADTVHTPRQYFFSPNASYDLIIATTAKDEVNDEGEGQSTWIGRTYWYKKSGSNGDPVGMGDVTPVSSYPNRGRVKWNAPLVISVPPEATLLGFEYSSTVPVHLSIRAKP